MATATICTVSESVSVALSESVTLISTLVGWARPGRSTGSCRRDAVVVSEPTISAVGAAGRVGRVDREGVLARIGDREVVGLRRALVRRGGGCEGDGRRDVVDGTPCACSEPIPLSPSLRWPRPTEVGLVRVSRRTCT